ncbi:DNA-binding response regulator, NarL/FixJ family, contains REC and HTH domains [Spirosomataceae bacterium TFI 002]|nr:DNA-binding response regulator, NarL/FixJ family, contains REC and HTH domains [Spirosomataceae bacterium TFI 002]
MGKIRIALVDDHHLFRVGLEQILSTIDDFEIVFQASNGQEFIDLYVKNKIDVVLLDISMPELNGMEVTEMLRKQGNDDLKIIILSMHAEDKFILHLMEIGANGYLLKDTDPDEVELAIRKVYDEGIYFTEYVGRLLLNKAMVQSRKQPFNYKVDLSFRELEVIELICKGYTAPEIGSKLNLSPRTVDGHRTRVMEKLNVKNTAQLVAHAITNKLIST